MWRTSIFDHGQGGGSTRGYCAAAIRSGLRSSKRSKGRSPSPSSSARRRMSRSGSATRRPIRRIGLLGGLFRKALKKRVCVAMGPEPPDQFVVAHSGRAVLRPDHRAADPTRGVQERGGVGAGDRGLSGNPQHQPRAVRPDQGCRPDPSQGSEGLRAANATLNNRKRTSDSGH